jgi:C1A family cysteine protease
MALISSLSPIQKNYLCNKSVVNIIAQGYKYHYNQEIIMYGKYSWQRDFHDARDYYVNSCSAFKLMAPSAVPTSADLRNYCSPIYDQGQIGSCTANALTGAMEYLENKTKEFEIKNEFINLSRLFVYYNERSIEGTINQDAGAQISDGVKTLQDLGICMESAWPYKTYRFKVKPSAKAFADAAARKIITYARVSRDNGMVDVKQVLASGYPVVFGFTVYDGFESEKVAKTGVLNMPAKTEQVVGGHAVMMVGYDDATQRVIVRNSWGPDWGQKGYFTMPYEYVTDRNLSNDYWSITK